MEEVWEYFYPDRFGKKYSIDLVTGHVRRNIEVKNNKKGTYLIPHVREDTANRQVAWILAMNKKRYTIDCARTLALYGVPLFGDIYDWQSAIQEEAEEHNRIMNAVKKTPRAHRFKAQGEEHWVPGKEHTFECPWASGKMDDTYEEESIARAGFDFGF